MANPTKNNTEDQEHRNGHILVVDDETAVRRLTKRILAIKGYSVTTCAGGAQAVKIYARDHDKIDLVILDMVMPGLNGTETLRQFKQIDPTVRVILCSAFVPDIKGHTVADEGFVDLISKPFKIDDLLAITDLHMK